MLSLVPKLHDLVGSTASRNLAQLRELGVEPGGCQASIAVIVEPSPSPGRQLLALTLLDMLLRLDPLVGTVIIDAPGMDEYSLASELAIRLPFTVTSTDTTADYVIGVGMPRGRDLSVDGAGWLAAIGAAAGTADDGNPIGPLAAAALATGEAFKWAFASVYPERAALLDLTSWNGVFSLFSYAFDQVSPPMPTVRISATLIGVGGVGAGFVRAIGALRDRVSGSLDLVDADVLTSDNLNRVSFATLQGALASTPKVHEAKAYLQQYCPNLTVTDHAETFDLYKSRIPRREDRLYDVAVTGLDHDQVRWEVQRDLPRILIDGATGKDMVARVERVELGRYGCLGCSRRPAPVSTQAPANCDAPPDKYAPSLSFLSSFPGILAAGEVIKEASGVRGLQGQYDHIFRYGPNPDLAGTPAIRADCPVSCSKPSRIAQYRRKYPREDFPV